MRSVDDVQYENRLRDFDFDIIIATWPQSLSPGNEQRDLWSSQAADTHGSRNYVGIKNPAVDTLIDRVVFAKSRGELVAATRALDRVMLWNHYVVPQFTDDRLRVAHWDRFGRPDRLPEYGGSAFPTVWWRNARKGRRDSGSVKDVADRGACDQANIPGGSIERLMAPRLKTTHILSGAPLPWFFVAQPLSLHPGS